jgi:predicted metal-dependent hydrolase
MKKADCRNKSKTVIRRFALWNLDVAPYSSRVSSKSERISAMVGQFRNGNLDPHYGGYFELFNRQKFYEAHDVLENLWLPQRHAANGDFYKGLIQLAGAFVHLQKNRLRPAAALFKLAQANLDKYPCKHEHLDLAGLQQLIGGWLDRLESQHFANNPLSAANFPRLDLVPPPA